MCDESPLGRRAPAIFERLSYDGLRVAPLSHGSPPLEVPRISGFSSSLQHGGVPGTKVVGESPTHAVHFACAVLKVGADIYYGQISHENLHLGLFLKKKWEDVAMPARQLLLRGDGSRLLLELGHALLQETTSQVHVPTWTLAIIGHTRVLREVSLESTRGERTAVRLLQTQGP